MQNKLTLLQDAQRAECLGSYHRPHGPNEAPKPWLPSTRPSCPMAKCYTRCCDQHRKDIAQGMEQMHLHESIRELDGGAMAPHVRSAMPSTSAGRHSNGGHGAEQLCRLPHPSSTTACTPHVVPEAAHIPSSGAAARRSHQRSSSWQLTTTTARSTSKLACSSNHHVSREQLPRRHDQDVHHGLSTSPMKRTLDGADGV